MPRRIRIPEGFVRRLALAGGMLVPLLGYGVFRQLPSTRDQVLSFESRIVRVTTRVGEAVAYVFQDSEREKSELSVCLEEKNLLANQVQAALYAKVGPERTFPVQVVARAYGGDEGSVLVWNGSGETFVVGEAVGVGSIFLGSVEQAKGDLAVVQLVTHEASEIPAMLAGKEDVVGVLSGTGGAWLEFNYVPKGSAVAVGDTVVTSGLGSSLSRGLIFGTVREIIDADPSPFYRIKVEPMVPSDAWWEAEVFHIPNL